MALHLTIIVQSSYPLYIIVPITLLIIDVYLKRLFGADHHFAGADVSLCGFGLLFTWFISSLIGSKLPTGPEAAQIVLICFIEVVMWVTCLKLASLKRLMPFAATWGIGTSVLVFSALLVNKFIERGII